MNGSNPIQLAIFASGSGSNALRIIEYFSNRTDIRAALILTNNKTAGVRDHADRYGIPHIFWPAASLANSGKTIALLEKYQIQGVVLAGFLAKIPGYLLLRFPDRILNIHPALLPDYGGKGMHGIYIHQAVHAAGESVSGLTIHQVNAEYDSGKIIFQCRIPLAPGSSPTDIAQRILKYEHYCYPYIIDQYFSGLD